MPYVVPDRDPSEGPRPDGSTLVLRSEVHGGPYVPVEPSLREIEAAPDGSDSCRSDDGNVINRRIPAGSIVARASALAHSRRTPSHHPTIMRP